MNTPRLTTDINIVAEIDTLFAWLHGDVDNTTLPAFAELLEHVYGAAFPCTMLDVSGLRHLSLAGARAIAQLHEESLIAGRDVCVVCRDDGPRAMLDAAGIGYRRFSTRLITP